MELQYRGSGKAFFNSKEYQCNLYYNEKLGGIILKINIKHDKGFGNYLELPLEIPYMHGQLDSGFRFSLLQLNRRGMQDLVSYGTSVYTYSADYIFCGIGNKEHPEQTFHKVTFTLSNIVEWGEESVYSIGENYELTSKNDDVDRTLYQGQGLCITYSVHGSMLPVADHELLKEQIIITQHGNIEICFEEEKCFKEFVLIFEKLKRLIEIASFSKINIEKVTAYSESVVYELGENTIERPVDVYGYNIKESDSTEQLRPHRWKWISLSELITNNSFEHYFNKHNKLAPIIELFLEPFYVDYSSETRTFLNIAQALETYHSRFITNSLDDFKTRVDDLVKDLPMANADATRKHLLAKSKKFITLESRLADLLLANHKIYFDTGKIKHSEFPSVIAHTRNYYIHYDENIKVKHRVLTEEELQIYNRALLQILDYYILLELGFNDNDVEIKNKLSQRWGNISQDLEIIQISRSQTSSSTSN